MTERAQKFVDNYDLDYFQESSAKTGMNVEEIFVQAAKLLYKDYLDYHNNDNKKKKKKEDTTTLITKSEMIENNNKKKKKCC